MGSLNDIIIVLPDELRTEVWLNRGLDALKSRSYHIAQALLHEKEDEPERAGSSLQDTHLRDFTGWICDGCSRTYRTPDHHHGLAADLWANQAGEQFLLAGNAEQFVATILQPGSSLEAVRLTRLAEQAVLAMEVPELPSGFNWQTDPCPGCGEKDWAVHRWTIHPKPLRLR